RGAEATISFMGVPDTADRVSHCMRSPLPRQVRPTTTAVGAAWRCPPGCRIPRSYWGYGSAHHELCRHLYRGCRGLSHRSCRRAPGFREADCGGAAVPADLREALCAHL